VGCDYELAGDSAVLSHLHVYPSWPGIVVCLAQTT
jgi:hypothetical protein